jgi:prepilin-type N-terminal cleavage/methylation domain-containing protein
MRRSVSHVSRRGGFTLVELLVVITIIAILFALFSAAAVKLIGKGDDVKLRSEVSQLALAVQSAQQNYQVSYFPDVVWLPPAFDPTGATGQFMKSMWTRLDSTSVNSTNGTVNVPNEGSYPVLAYWGVSSPIKLQGDQALVFWLGGLRDSSGVPIGFSTDSVFPMKRSGQRVSPFYSGFSVDRLRVFAGPNRGDYPSFVDTFGAAPYLYFSTGKSENSYSNPITLVVNGSQMTINPFLKSGTGTSPRFVNPASFQIVSAGRDGIFGAGLDQWAGYYLSNGTNGSSSLQGYDDVANFHPTFLGVPNQ